MHEIWIWGNVSTWGKFPTHLPNVDILFWILCGRQIWLFLHKPGKYSIYAACTPLHVDSGCLDKPFFKGAGCSALWSLRFSLRWYHTLSSSILSSSSNDAINSGSLANLQVLLPRAFSGNFWKTRRLEAPERWCALSGAIDLHSGRLCLLGPDTQAFFSAWYVGSSFLFRWCGTLLNAKSDPK